MIEAPPDNYFPLVIMLSSFIFLGIGIVFCFTRDISNKLMAFLLGSFMVIFFIGFSLLLSDSSIDEYKNAVNAEIESLQCSQMQEHYDFYSESEFKEKIKSKYLFECVSEKADLDWLK